MKKEIVIVSFAVLFAAALSFCIWDTVSAGKNESKTLEEGASDGYFSVTAADLDTEAGTGSLLSPDEYGKTEEIREPGTYILSGEYKDTIFINTEDQNVHLILDNVVIGSPSGPAIYARSAGKLFITAKEGTENHLSDSAYYTDKEANAAIFANCDLTINGSGSLFVSGYNKDAVHGKRIVKVLDAKVSLKSKRCGIRGNDGIYLSPEVLTVESEKFGLQTVDSGTPPRGDIEITGGTLSMIAGDTGISSQSDVYVSGCSLAIQAVVSPVTARGEQHLEEGAVTIV